MMEEIKAMIENRQRLALLAREQYSPLVESILTTGNKDVNHICYTLDGILDFCFDEQMLQLYRRLCRYLMGIDQQAAVDYVNDYREMWDEEGKNFGINHSKELGL